MKILRLSSKNVKRLKAVEITPEGNLVIIGGGNGQGKTSVLDSIAYALGGKDVICREPVRRGEKSAEVTCDLGDLVVRRTFTPDGGGSLTVENKDGARFTSPQGRLDDLIGRLSFDPLAFTRMDSAKQAETLRTLLGLDFTDLDAQRASAFAQRTDLNREGKALRARFDALPERHAGVPESEVPSAKVLAELERAQSTNEQHAEEHRRLADMKRGFELFEQRIGLLREQIEEKKTAIARLQDELVATQVLLDSRQREAKVERLRLSEAIKADKALVDVDLGPIKERLAGVEELNRQVRENQLNEQLARELDAKRAESAALSEQIEAITDQKQTAIAAAEFPVAGLGFEDAGGVTLNSLPFDQASAAEQLRISVAIGIALNPKLRVLLIRDASLLDEESLRLVGEMADQHDAQLWLERVEDGGATVVIEDGSIAEESAAAGAEA